MKEFDGIKKHGTTIKIIRFIFFYSLIYGADQLTFQHGVKCSNNIKIMSITNTNFNYMFCNYIFTAASI